MYNKTIFYLDEKSDIAAKAFIKEIKKKNISYQELNQIIKTFNVQNNKQEKKQFLSS